MSGGRTGEAGVSAGDKRLSSFDRHGNGEPHQGLYETLGTSNSLQGVSFDRTEVDSHNFTLAFDIQKVRNHAAGSGMNLSHGQLLNTHLSDAGTATSNYVKKAYTSCRYNVILELTSTGASVYF